jgi:hypothetical protein
MEDGIDETNGYFRRNSVPSIFRGIFAEHCSDATLSASTRPTARVLPGLTGGEGRGGGMCYRSIEECPVLDALTAQLRATVSSSRWHIL